MSLTRKALLLTAPLMLVTAVALLRVERGEPFWVKRTTDTVYVRYTQRIRDTVWVQQTVQDSILYIACPGRPVQVIHYPARLGWGYHLDDGDKVARLIITADTTTLVAISHRRRCTVSRIPITEP